MKRSREHSAKITLAKGVLVLFVVLGGSLSSLVRPFFALAVSAPNIVSYQGRVLNANGVPVADASASMVFAFYDAATVGTCLWSNSSGTCATTTARTVTLTDGLFSENLGDTSAGTPYAAIADTVFANNAAVYLEVRIGGETLSPRKQIVAAPYALNADTVDGFDTTQAGGTTAKALVLDSSGNLQLTGTGSAATVGGGPLYINPASGNVVAGGTLFGIAIDGSQMFKIDDTGNETLTGDLYVNGNDIVTSSGGLELSSNSTFVDVKSGNDFAVGGSTLTSPFSVDESANTVRIGDGANDANTPTLTFYASDATDSGSIAYHDNDYFDVSGGDFIHTGTGTVPATSGAGVVGLKSTSGFSATTGDNLAILHLISINGINNYSGTEGGGTTDNYLVGTGGALTISGDSTLTYGFGVSGSATNSSTNAQPIPNTNSYITGVDGLGIQSAAAKTIAAVYGVHGSVRSAAGTATQGVGVMGEVLTDSGTITTGFGGWFKNTTAGTTRYGVYGDASGGTTNYSGFFADGRVQIDEDTTANTPGTATGAGSLYVADAIEGDGTVTFGDTTGTDLFTFTSAGTTTTLATYTLNSLTSGTGVAISRASGGADIDGTLLSISQLNTSATSDATGLLITNSGAGTSIGLHIVQNTTSAHGAAATGNNAFVVDVNEAASSDDAMMLRSDADGTPDTEWRVTTAGDAYADGAFSGGGADLAEFFASNDATLGSSMMVCTNTTTPLTVKTCEAGNTNIIGVVSTDPAFIGNSITQGSEDLRTNPNYRLVGLVGQVKTRVSADGGAIAVGDAITTSTSAPGYGAKATVAGRVVGYALESLSSGTGTITVLVQPGWYGGSSFLTSNGGATVSTQTLVLAPLANATIDATTGSASLVLNGSAWNGATPVATGMSLATEVASATDYALDVVDNDGARVAFVNNRGDTAIAGRLYPSDRGTLQTEKYIYYDGSAGSGGDVMRTNASGWGSGSYDFAEMFPAIDALTAGELVVFANDKEQVMRSTGKTYDEKIAGVVSTRPGFVAGANTPGSVAVALSGRVPTYVTGENGAIAIGDPLTSSSKPGFAMKATQAGPIVGYAMEAWSGADIGSIISVIRPSYYDGGTTASAPAANNSASNLSGDVSKVDTSSSANSGNLLGIETMTGIGSTWHLDDSGTFTTHGQFVQLIRSYQGVDVPTYVAASREPTVQISGTAMLQAGEATVAFEQIDPDFNDIIGTDANYRVLVTAGGLTGMLYVVERTTAGFVIHESPSMSSGIPVDWLVIAYTKDYVPPAPIDPAIPVPSIVVVETPTPKESTDVAPLPADAVSDAPTPSDALPDLPADTPVEPEPATVDATTPSADTAITPEATSVETSTVPEAPAEPAPAAPAEPSAPSDTIAP